MAIPAVGSEEVELLAVGGSEEVELVFDKDQVQLGVPLGLVAFEFAEEVRVVPLAVPVTSVVVAHSSSVVFFVLASLTEPVLSPW
jgi:hypothetical protein